MHLQLQPELAKSWWPVSDVEGRNRVYKPGRITAR